MPQTPPPSAAVILSAALRVISRSATIQIEEAAAHSASKSRGTKVKEPDLHHDEFYYESLSNRPSAKSTVGAMSTVEDLPDLMSKEQGATRSHLGRTNGAGEAEGSTASAATIRSDELRRKAGFSQSFKNILDVQDQIKDIEVDKNVERARKNPIWDGVEKTRQSEPELETVTKRPVTPISPEKQSTIRDSSDLSSTTSSTPSPSDTLSKSTPAMTASKLGKPVAPNVSSSSFPNDSLPTAKQVEKDAKLAQNAVKDLSSVPVTEKSVLEDSEDEAPVVLRASTVPSSRIGRLFHYGSLAASLSWGAASESIRRSTGSGGTGSVFMSDANIRRLVATLGRMRGAALKLGQFMSIQDNNMLPPEIERVLQQVQAHANYMPDWQMEKVLITELGPNWQSLFTTFDRTPIASASIGQVHRATLAEDGIEVAVKIQFPGVSSSINSDLANLSLLLRGSAVLPKGLYLQNTIAVMRRELEDECDYVREGQAGRKFQEFLKGDEFFVVPKVVEEATTGKVLTTEWMSGKPLSRMKHMSQETKDKIGQAILRLCLQELFQFRFMQTDPNWANFLYDSNKDKLQLIDFGASREYTKEFMDGWYRLLTAALRDDRVAMKVESESLGYLTGDEEEVMLDAHLKSMSLLASPFRHQGLYSFANQTITESVRSLIPIMLQHRLTPPPPETYSLNRKLSGAFLMCSKLDANVDCGRLWEEIVGGYREGPDGESQGERAEGRG